MLLNGISVAFEFTLKRQVENSNWFETQTPGPQTNRQGRWFASGWRFDVGIALLIWTLKILSRGCRPTWCATQFTRPRCDASGRKYTHTMKISAKQMSLSANHFTCTCLFFLVFLCVVAVRLDSSGHAQQPQRALNQKVRAQLCALVKRKKRSEIKAKLFVPSI